MIQNMEAAAKAQTKRNLTIHHGDARELDGFLTNQFI